LKTVRERISPLANALGKKFMHPVTIILIALGLSMDAFAVSLASGAAVKELRLQHALRMALFFGSFQAFMPVIGWLAGTGLRGFIAGFDHWIAFALLSAIGGKMIYESTRIGEHGNAIDPFNFSILLLLSIATSIDALAVGVSFAFIGVDIVAPVIIIGLITFVLSLLGVYIGDKVGHLFERTMAIFGGLILIAIGVKILIEHLT
jgi:putative Mn2+ efflux pump MntP